MSACLMLHGIGPIPPAIADVEKPYWITEATFDFILAGIAARGGRLTFDDGNDTDLRIALPKLRAAGLTASFYIPTNCIGTPGYVGENDIRALHEAGMEVGSHGAAHLDWVKSSDGEIAADVTQSVERLAEIIHAPVRSVAIPYGSCDRRVLAVLRRLGIGRVYSSFRGPDVEGTWLVRRDCIKADMGPMEINEILTRAPDAAATALNFLRIWRHAGNAALWAA
jgi:peptidoglycan/xylan/chitin deacetylase (PgdA/CDA1 family)